VSQRPPVAALLPLLLLLLLGWPGLAADESVSQASDESAVAQAADAAEGVESEAAEDDGVESRAPSASKLRKQNDKAREKLHSDSPKKQVKGKAELERLETEASDKLDRALESNKARKQAKIRDREHLVDEVQDSMAADGVPLRQPRRRWRPPVVVGDQVAVDPGDFVGTWRNARRLAEGAQGSVDLLIGQDDRVGEVLVLKSTKAAQADRARQVRLLAREAEMQNVAAGDGHPNFVRARQLADNQIAMPYAGGRLTDALGRLKNRDQVSAAEYKAVAQYLTREMLGAAQHMDEVGVVHRDLKPDNLLLDPTDRRLKIVDFGTAKRADESDNELSKQGVARGTPQYMSTEAEVAQQTRLADDAFYARERAKHPDWPATRVTGPKSDVFSIGRILQRDLAADGLGEGFDDLRAQLTRSRVDQRPNAAEALAHPFLSEPTGVSPARVQEILRSVALAGEVTEARVARLARPYIAPDQALRRPPGQTARQPRPPIPSFDPPAPPGGP